MVQVYERRLARALEGADIPRHVGVIMDGNRRWARAIGLEDVAHGHRRGADKIVDLLGWCDDAGVSVVTLFMLSTDNLSRPEPEVRALLQIIEDVAVDLARPGRRWQVRAMGAPEVLPSETVAVLKQAEEDTCDRPGATVNLAVGYGGRQELAARVRSLLAEDATPCARCWPSTPSGAPRWRSWWRRWRSSTSPRTSTPAASPTPTWSSVPAGSSACPASCSGRRRTPSSTSPTCTGPTSGGWTSCGHCATTPRGTAGSGADPGMSMRAAQAGPTIARHRPFGG